jgi:hypothetical protein
MNDTAPHRERLPNRRRAESRTFEFNNQFFEVGYGFYENGRPGEVFARSTKPGSQIDTLLDDAGTIVSVALQSGISPLALAKSLGRTGPDGPRSSILGCIIDALADLEAGGVQ